jgi:hypothetical protein
MFTKAVSVAGVNKPVSPVVATQLWERLRSKWYGWILTSLANHSDVGKVQMSYLTNFIKFLGLSRLGQNALQSLGMLNTLRYGDGKQQEAIEHQVEANRFALALCALCELLRMLLWDCSNHRTCPDHTHLSACCIAESSRTTTTL